MINSLINCELAHLYTTCMIYHRAVRSQQVFQRAASVAVHMSKQIVAGRRTEAA